MYQKIKKDSGGDERKTIYLDCQVRVLTDGILSAETKGKILEN